MVITHNVVVVNAVGIRHGTQTFKEAVDFIKVRLSHIAHYSSAKSFSTKEVAVKMAAYLTLTEELKVKVLEQSTSLPPIDLSWQGLG